MKKIYPSYNDSDAIKNMKKYYNDTSIVEQEGVRVAETTVDGITMAFLKGLFDGFVDGFISPPLYSPYHIEKENNIMSPEMIIFNPLKSGIKQLNYSSIDYIIEKLPKVSVNYLVMKNHKLTTLRIEQNSLSFYMKGGKKTNHPLELFNDYINEGDKEYINTYNKALKKGNKYRHIVNNVCVHIEAPVPTCQIRIIN
jgi:hypothetical protein